MHKLPVNHLVKLAHKLVKFARHFHIFIGVKNISDFAKNDCNVHCLMPQDL